MVQQGQIDHLLQETGQILPPPTLVQQAFLQDHEAAYKAVSYTHLTLPTKA